VSIERKWEARRNSNVIQVSQLGELAAISRRAHVCNRKSSGIGIASSVGQTASSKVAALVGASVADAGQHGAHSKQLLASARCKLGAACIALDAPLLRRKAHSRAHGTVDAERGAGRRYMF
jgi:hypothetical protein